MEAKNTKFAIITKRIDLKLNRGFLNGITNFEEKEKILVDPGTLIKVINNNNNNNYNNHSGSHNGSSNSRYSIVQVMDYFNQNLTWEYIYDCPNSSLKKVHEDIWPFTIAISDPQRRLQFILNGDQCKFVLYLKVNDIVCVSGEPFGNNSVRYDCIIRYIGLVQEIGPGYYFGLELLHLQSGNSPQAENIPFSLTYMSCKPTLAIIITADWISHLPSEEKRKFSPRELLCGTLEKARTAIGFNSSSSSSGSNSKQSSSTLRRSGLIKKNHKKSSDTQSQFYLNSQYLDENNKSDDNDENYIGNGNTNENENENHETDSAMDWNIGMNLNQKTTNLCNDKGTKINSKLESKITTVNCGGDGCSSSSNRLKSNDKIAISNKVQNLIGDNNHKILYDNEDYNKYVENYEKTLERQHEINRNTPSPAPYPIGILKTAKYRRLTTSSIDENNKNNSGNKMNLDERDIIVIDKSDIKESTKNEASLIVVNNPRQQQQQQQHQQQQQKDFDLVDVLGGNWPNNASDAAFVLNKQTTTSSDQSGGGGGSSNIVTSTSGGNNYISSNSSNSSGSYNTQKIDRNKLSHTIGHRSQVQERNRNRDNNQWTQTSGSDSITSENSNIGGRSKEKKFKNTIEPPLYDNVNSADVGNNSGGIVTLASPEKEFIQSSPLPDIPGTSLGVGSMVEVSTDITDDLYGVIRWIGSPHGHKTIYVGVELEDDINDKRLPTSDGTFNGIRLFKCQDGKGVFVQPNQCSKDRRFVDIDTTQGIKINSKQQLDSKMFGHMECLPVHEDIPSLKILNLDELEEICGKFKGIQGHHNSCYLDATLFSMFTFTSVFDSLLYRPPEPEDIPHYVEVQKVLREEIVNPLRKNVFVRADRVMKLRQLLDKLSSVSGLTSEEKDPEEFLNSLLAQIMRAEPFLKLSSGQDAFYYQLFVEKDERLSFPSVQQLFEQSFLSSDIKLKEVPSCLIIQMPRFGKNFKMYPRILPSQVLDVTDIIEDSPRQCTVCGKLAEYECRECFGILQCGVGLESTAFCRKCLETVHTHVKRTNHTAKEISVPQEFKSMAEHVMVPRLFMELFAVVCIETSHYVAFVKAGSGLDAPWCFFDSMADRKGEQNGYNIPEMISVPDLPQWLSEDGARAVNETSSNDKMLPEHAKRLFCDAYMCMYQSTDVMMYR